MELPGITITEAGGQVFFHFLPVPGRTALAPSALHALLDASPYREYERNDDAITLAAGDCSKQPEPFFVLAATRRDAAISVRVSADDMQASATLTRARGGQPATVQGVLLALHQAGVRDGIDLALVESLCLQGVADDVCVARGEPPVDGRNTAFQPLTPQTVDRTPQLDEFGRIDYREHGGILMVKAGTALMRRIPPTPGIDGHTVRARLLPARPGLNQSFTAPLSGAAIDPKDPDLLVAQTAGQPVLVHQGMTVEPVLRVAEVNLAVGNIHFDGTVEVGGDVVQGMTVQASGDIVVKGMVDGGRLEAGGDIHVAFGVIALSHLNAKGSIHARFAENSHLEAGTVIALHDMALQCDLVSLNQIVVGDSGSRRGRLVGGSASALLLLHVPTLGSSKGGSTHITMAHNPRLQAQLQSLQTRIQAEESAEVKLHQLVKQFTAAGDPHGLLPKIKASWQKALQQWSVSLAERVRLKEELAVLQTARIELAVGAEGAVDLAFGSKSVRMRSDLGPGVITLAADAHLVHTSANGRETVIG